MQRMWDEGLPYLPNLLVDDGEDKQRVLSLKLKPRIGATCDMYLPGGCDYNNNRFFRLQPDTSNAVPLAFAGPSTTGGTITPDSYWSGIMVAVAAAAAAAATGVDDTATKATIIVTPTPSRAEGSSHLSVPGEEEEEEFALTEATSITSGSLTSSTDYLWYSDTDSDSEDDER